MGIKHRAPNESDSASLSPIKFHRNEISSSFLISHYLLSLCCLMPPSSKQSFTQEVLVLVMDSSLDLTDNRSNQRERVSVVLTEE